MTTTESSQPSVAAMNLSKTEYIELCDRFRDKAQEEHQDARGWMNRAILAESQLATVRASYEPPRSRTLPDLFDAAGNPEQPLPTTHPDQE
jgi:hypothetical protein